MSTSITTDRSTGRRLAAGAPPRPSRLWLFFVAAFALQFAAWTAWFIIAAHHHVDEVPLQSAVGHKP